MYVPEAEMADNNGQTTNLKRRIDIFLEDGDWDSAKDYCNRLLDIDPDDPSAYLLLTLAENEVSNVDGLVEKRIDITRTKYYKRIANKGNPEVDEIIGKLVLAYMDATEEDSRKEKYVKAKEYQQKGTPESLKQASSLFSELSGYLDADERKKECNQNVPVAEGKRKNGVRILLVILLVIMAIYCGINIKQKKLEPAISASLVGNSYYMHWVSVMDQHHVYEDNGSVYVWGVNTDGSSQGAYWRYGIKRKGLKKYVIDIAQTDAELFSGGDYDYVVTKIVGTQIVEYENHNGKKNTFTLE